MKAILTRIGAAFCAKYDIPESLILSLKIQPVRMGEGDLSLAIQDLKFPYPVLTALPSRSMSEEELEDKFMADWDAAVGNRASLTGEKMFLSEWCLSRAGRNLSVPEWWNSLESIRECAELARMLNRSMKSDEILSRGCSELAELEMIWGAMEHQRDECGVSSELPQFPSTEISRSIFDQMMTAAIEWCRVSSSRLAEAAGENQKPVELSKMLLSNREIVEAVERDYSKEEWGRIRRLNILHNGPIILGTRGKQSRCDRQALLRWYRELGSQYQEKESETEARDRDRRLSVQERHDYGITGTVIPEIAGSVKKHRCRNAGSLGSPSETEDIRPEKVEKDLNR